MEKSTTGQIAITLTDFAGMQWDFWEHNTKPIKGAKLRMLCRCESCETLRCIDSDDRHIWPNTRGGQLVRAGGMTREEYVKIVVGELNRIHDEDV